MDNSSRKKLKIIPNKSIDIIGEILDNPSILGKHSLARDYESINKSTNTSNKLPNNESSTTANKSSINSNSNSNKLNPTDYIPTKTKRKIEDDENVEVNPKRKTSNQLNTVKNQEENSMSSRSSTKKGMENYAQKNIERYNQSSYNIMDVLETKRNLRNSSHTTPFSDSNDRSSSLPKQNVSNFKDPRTNRSKLINNQNASENLKSTELKVNFSFKKQLEESRLSDKEPQPSSSKESSSSSTKESQSSSSKESSNQNTNQLREDFLYSILRWPILWFKTPDHVGDKLCEHNLNDPKLSYESFEEYLKYFKPLILNEILMQISEKIETINHDNFNRVKVFVQQYQIADNFLVLNCVLPVKTQDFNKSVYPIEGDLMIIEMSLCGVDRLYTMLGYLAEFAIEDINEKTKLNFNLSNNFNKLLKFIIKLKPMNIKIDVSKTIRCAPVYYLKPSLRQCEALLNLDKSSLCEGIIKPDKLLKQIKYDSIIRDDGKYNSSQLNVISNAKELVNDSKPGILLVHGPPGAGKTHTLIGMVKKIFLEWKDENSSPKILICAPSNGAIDEIGKRLFKEKDFLSKSKLNRHLRIIRIGQEDKMNDFVKQNMFLDTLIEKNVRIEGENKGKIEREKIEKEKELVKLELEENSLLRDKKFDKVKEVKSKINFLRSQIKYLEMLCIDSKKQIQNDQLKKKLRNDLLIKCDIVLTTLSSSCSSSLLQIFDNNRMFNCCIIDECSQCTEPELLMPLCYSSMSKLILIGDPMQLPATTISPIASNYGFNRSLFERFYLFIKQNPSAKKYLIMLNVQYRMHEEICLFPSRLFYDNKLNTDKAANRNFPLLPYMVFDVADTIECKTNVKNIHNEKESDFVLKLAFSCVELIKNYKQFDKEIIKIGIITPYQGQRRLLKELIKHSNSKHNKFRIEVNTIDGFQGREMDIIIISAVRSNNDQNGNIGFLNSNQRLNVAITRAKCSLFICLNANSLSKFNMWNELIEDAKRRNCFQNCNSDIEPNFIENLIADFKFKC